MPAPKTEDKIKLWKERLSKSLKGRTSPMKGKHFVMSDDHKRKISAALKKYKRTAEHQKNLNKSLSGKKRPWLLGNKNPSWVGDKVSYSGIHTWARRHFGQPNVCDFCGTKKSKRYEWANISKTYKRERNDWFRLCSKCHRRYDDNAKKMWKTRKENKLNG